MKVEKTQLHGVKLITPPTNFEDFRGSYVELYNEKYIRNTVLHRILFRMISQLQIKTYLEAFMEIKPRRSLYLAYTDLFIL